MPAAGILPRNHASDGILPRNHASGGDPATESCQRRGSCHGIMPAAGILPRNHASGGDPATESCQQRGSCHGIMPAAGFLPRNHASSGVPATESCQRQDPARGAVARVELLAVTLSNMSHCQDGCPASAPRIKCSELCGFLKIMDITEPLCHV
ncbi:hypothetical protein NDU88_000105 [Pleurodeles waltl]|uniref:Uncharacterized protein n=1 Tax=Pleurodeles waltl TaxID=8319 RepID=A0AAV7N998_PLEWA|nr:hypothetical protein NDU88_000105 [Pleurodeles waltl]